MVNDFLMISPTFFPILISYMASQTIKQFLNCFQHSRIQITGTNRIKSLLSMDDEVIVFLLHFKAMKQTSTLFLAN